MDLHKIYGTNFLLIMLALILDKQILYDLHCISIAKSVVLSLTELMNYIWICFT